MKKLSGTSRRLVLAFASLVALFATASVITLRGLSELHELAHDAKHTDERSRTLLSLVSASRDQYAELLGAVIIGDTARYDQAYSGLLGLLGRVATIATTPSERALLSDVQQASARLDSLLREELGRAAPARESSWARQLYARAQPLLTSAQGRLQELARPRETVIDRFDDHAGVIQHSSVRWTLGALIAYVLLAIIVGVYISRSIAGPVARLGEGAARLAAGDLTHRIVVRGDDEFARLAEQFNRMTEALEVNQARLIESEKLAGIGRLAAGVAHEINNPLGVILGYVRVLRGSSEQSAVTQELQIIEDEAIRCHEIVESLLDLARPPKMTREPIALGVLTEEVVARLQHTGVLTAVRLMLESDVEIQGSSSGLRQILMNLLRNAAEAAGEHGSVGVRLSVEEAEVHLSVTDTGKGIEAANRGHLFAPFFTTKPTGTGLGLAISRTIARAHGGELTLDPDVPNTTFTLRLPVRREQVS